MQRQLEMADRLEIVNLFLKEVKRSGAGARVTHYFNRVHLPDLRRPFVSKSSKGCGFLQQSQAGAAAAINGQGPRRGDCKRIRVLSKVIINGPPRLANYVFSRERGMR